MTTKKQKLEAVRKKMRKAPTFHHFVADIGYNVYRLTRELEGQERANLIGEYVQCVSKHGFSDILEHQIDYAMRLITPSDGKLLYEEVQKLFSLCDEIESLKALGLVVNDSKYREFNAALRSWFKNNSSVANIVARDLRDDWKKAWWWYAENL